MTATGVMCIFYRLTRFIGSCRDTPIYGGVFRQDALFAPKCGKITVIPREPLTESHSPFSNREPEIHLHFFCYGGS